jgi:hypothetical protein
MDGGQTIYLRTPLGNAELKVRRSELGAVANGVLMLVNGQRSRDDLLAVVLRLGAASDSLDMLQAKGYISATNGSAPAPAVAPLAASGLSDNECRARLYEHLIGAAKTHLGLKGFAHHMKIEKAVSLEDLRGLVQPLGEAVAKSKGLAAANEFLEKARVFA